MALVGLNPFRLSFSRWLDITVTGDHVTVQYQTKKETEKKGKKTYFCRTVLRSFCKDYPASSCS